MRTPPTPHHGYPMGTREHHSPDTVQVGDIVHWTAGGETYEGVTTGREGCAVAEVWWVYTEGWIGRVHRHQIIHHEPPETPWRPTVIPSHDAPDVDLDRLREALLEHSWDDAIARLGITPDVALRLWDQLLHEEASVG